MLTKRGAAASAVAAALSLVLSACGGSGKVMPVASRSVPSTAMLPFEGDGLDRTVDGYTFARVRNTATVGRPGEVSFVIDNPKGKPQRDFTLQQTKLLHMYVVRDDLTEFQHIHPGLDHRTGRWTVPITFAEPGPYRVVIEFEALKADGTFDDRILGAGLTVAGAYRPVRFTPAIGTNTADGYTVTMPSTAAVRGPNLRLTVTKDGAGVTDIQQYLQSYAHITGFREGSLQAVHVHPLEVPPFRTDPNAVGGPNLTLMSMFTKPGVYRMFIQFQTDGRVHTVPLDITVTAPAGH
jgi:hypothetical protein